MAQDPFGDIPLFREIQRILASGEGPINLEIARQVGVAAATQGLSEPTPSPTSSVLSGAVHDAEILLAGYTRMTLDEPMQTRVVNRTTWVASTLDAWRWILEHLARRFGEQTAGALGDEGGGIQQSAMQQVVPLLLGLQTGTLLGALAQDVLGRYDLPIPREDDGRLIFVEPNIRSVVDEYGFDGDAFARWLALHESARHLVRSGRPWV